MIKLIKKLIIMPYMEEVHYNHQALTFQKSTTYHVVKIVMNHAKKFAIYMKP